MWLKGNMWDFFFSQKKVSTNLTRGWSIFVLLLETDLVAQTTSEITPSKQIILMWRMNYSTWHERGTKKISESATGMILTWPPTISRHCPPSWAILPSCFHEWRVLFISFSNYRRKVFRGLPPLRWPWRFQFRAWQTINVRQSHLHLLYVELSWVYCFLAIGFWLLMVS